MSVFDDRSVDLKILNPLMGSVIPLPEYATSGSAAMDLRACLTQALTISMGETILIPTGIAIHMRRRDMAAMILPRSGLGHKHGLVLGNLIGLIDSDYQGEIKISCWNRGIADYSIAQLLFIPIFHTSFNIVQNFDATERGEGGFGHTGGH